MTIADGRRYANRILFTAPRGRDAAPVHTDLAHLAAIALMDATLQELGTMPAGGGHIKGVDLHFVIRIATARRIQAFPVSAQKYYSYKVVIHWILCRMHLHGFCKRFAPFVTLVLRLQIERECSFARLTCQE